MGISAPFSKRKLCHRTNFNLPRLYMKPSLHVQMDLSEQGEVDIWHLLASSFTGYDVHLDIGAQLIALWWWLPAFLLPQVVLLGRLGPQGDGQKGGEPAVDNFNSEMTLLANQFSCSKCKALSSSISHKDNIFDFLASSSSPAGREIIQRNWMTKSITYHKKCTSRL